MPIAMGARRLGYAVAIALASAAILPGQSARAGGHGDHSHGDHGHGEHQEASPAAHGHDGDGHDMGHQHGGHHHGTLAIPEGQPVPSVALAIHDDALTGWNLELELQNFTLAPERVNQASNATEGHAHLYINGEKLTRLYGPWYYISALPAGEHEVRVELNANGHELLMHNGDAIADTVILEVP